MKLIYTESELPQRSEKWLELRKKTIGGSEVPTMLDLTRFGDSPQTLWQRKTGRKKPKEMNDAMRRGTILEPEALAKAKEELGDKVNNIETFFVIHPEHDYMSVSYDGVDLENKVILELKCPSSVFGFKKVLENGIPDYYYAQVQWQLMISNATWGITKAYFCSYFPDGFGIVDYETFTENMVKMAIVEVDHNPEYCDKMVKVAKVFYDAIQYDFWDDEKYSELIEEFHGELNDTI